MNQKKALDSLSSLTRMLGVSKAQYIIQVYNNTQSLATAEEDYGFSLQGENPRGYS